MKMGYLVIKHFDSDTDSVPDTVFESEEAASNYADMLNDELEDDEIDGVWEVEQIRLEGF